MPPRQPQQHPLTRLIAAISLMTCLTLTMALPPKAEAQSTTANAPQVQVKGASFARTIEGDRRYDMLGHGLFTYMVWDAYAGAYYQAAGFPRPAPLSDVPRQLVLHYFHAIDAEDFAEATTRTVREQVNEVNFDSVRSELSRLTDSYRDVQPGDRYALRWSGEQLTLSLNGTPLFQSPNLELAIAMFAIWLGSDPLDDGFRDALLGR
ncbi:chalcone isomerase family protein [Halomonas sp. DP8Y7-3]|uniref:chalcone isomerase family protein n=1 Tax=Halomonas sp. DP8Y7-3 TaxID=2859079 RepID=UPI001C9490B6|nr:chalcone isomerase family protein [Halomonas sp. DP8Y7-3]MBY5929056.1 chalcone isomerase family protein [Halomonas sp. DP8Y7-3]